LTVDYKEEALKLLKRSLKNKDAEFREHQWESIDQIINHQKKLLLIQRTGWGKSSVYFICTKILRQKRYGPVLIISPLLSLIRNQILSSKALNLKVSSINSTNKNEWEPVTNQIHDNKIDALLISPERLSNQEFIDEVLIPVSKKIGLLVVDEAHCISDWGHDFRPDYKKISLILSQMPPKVSILATTATANNRVIEDIENQINDIKVIKGKLIRKSLHLQNFGLTPKNIRLAWLAKNIPLLDGTGIIYVLTVNDAHEINNWLYQNNIDCAAYFGPLDDSIRTNIEERLLKNEIKVVVATKALGMGFDKPDLSFVIHYQMPSSVIQYYQEIGRAGRSINKAIAVLFSGSEDDDIHDFFRNNAFAKEHDISLILDAFKNHESLTLTEFERILNMRREKIETILKQLESFIPSPIYRLKNKYYLTPNEYEYPSENIEKITQERVKELNQMHDYLSSQKCLMQYLAEALDDHQLQPCGKCSSCLKHNIISKEVSIENIEIANQFINNSEFDFKTPTRIPKNSLITYSFFGKSFTEDLKPNKVKVFSRWAHEGWGKKIQEAKKNGAFNDEIINAVSKMIERWNVKFSCVTCVPSLKNPKLVSEFSKKIALLKNVKFISAIKKVKQNDFQKLQQNSFHQANNLDGVFEINTSELGSSVLLIDDIIDSGWTIAICSALLKYNGVKEVYVLALASSSFRN